MKRLVRFTVGMFLLGFAAFSTRAAFTSFYIFGDSVSTTTNNGTVGTNYYGKRFTNGRVWVEVLAQQQGLAYDSNKNWSYFGNYSATTNTTDGTLVPNIISFTNHPPSDISTALFAIWVNSADLFFDVSNLGTNITTWTNAINLAQSNHLKAIQILYSSGVRTLVMPDAVDISTIPQFATYSPANRNFIRQRVIDYNKAFSNTLNQARATLPGVTIYVPDVFTLLNNLLANPAYYGLTNAGIGAVQDTLLKDKSLSGPGANYIYWDQSDPTAKIHALVGDLAQQLISPVQISQITALDDSNRLDMANIPIGLNGFVDGSSNLVPVNWMPVANISSTNTLQSVLVPVAGPLQFYRLRFPYAWSWP